LYGLASQSFFFYDNKQNLRQSAYILYFLTGITLYKMYKVLKTYERLIYGNTHSVSNPLCKRVFKIATNYPRLWISFCINVPPIISTVFFHKMYWHMYRLNYTYNCTHTYPLSMNFIVGPCINNIKHFIVQLMHTNYKILRLLKQLKL
jgi:hypothetical protein